MRTTSINDAFDEAVKLRPTLLIGAGGTGYDVVVQVKARFHETYPLHMLNQIKFVAFDTDTYHPPIRNNKNELISLVPNKELFQIGGVPVKGIIENQGYYAAIREELELDRLPQLDLTKGAKQTRQLGRLAFFYHFERIKNVIMSCLNEVTNISHYRSTGAAEIQAINVFYISSAAGGTGSGILLDLAYLTRYLAHANGIPTDYIFNIGLLVMPEAFTKVPRSSRPQIRANAAAMLMEVDHFTTYRDFNVLYPDGMRVRDNRPPFNITYLVDATNERGLTVEDANQLNPILAEAVFLQAGTYLGASTDSAFDNVAAARGDDRSGYTGLYSMLGTSAWHFNAQRMQRATALQLQQQLVSNLLLAPLPRFDPTLDPENNCIHPVIRDRVDAFTANANLDVGLAKTQLKTIPSRRNMLIELNTAVHDRAPLQAIVSRVENMCASYSQRTVSGEYIPQVEKNRTLMLEQVREALFAGTYQIVNTLSSGPLLAQAFLEGILIAFEPTRKQLTKERQQLRQRSVRIQRDLQTSYDAFTQIAQGNFMSRFFRHNVRQARNHYTDQYKRSLDIILSQAIINNIFTLLDEAEREVQQLLGAVSTLSASLERAANEADIELRRLRVNWGSSHATEQAVDSVDMIDSFYNRYLNSTLNNEGRELVSTRPMSEWLQLLTVPPDDPFLQTDSTEESLGRWLSDYCMASFSLILTNESIEKLILDRYPTEIEQQNALRALISLGAPFSNYITTAAGHGSDELDPILVVGVPDKNRSIFRDVTIPDASLISTYDPHRVSALHTKHGLPMNALRQFGEYKRFFNDLQARVESSGTTPFIAFNAVREGITARRLFMRGEAYNYITRRNMGGYFLEVEEQSIHLGSTLEDAIKHIIQHAEAYDQLKRALYSFQFEINESQALVFLEDYLKNPPKRPLSRHSAELKEMAVSERNLIKQLI
ncbi:MAG: tubulin-like doman-containing protein [Candidatus Promineifilaceae bacterium]